MALTIDQPGSIARLTDSIQVQLPGALYDVVRMALWDTIEDFCSRSGYWRETVAWSLTAGLSVVLSTGDPGKLIQQVIEVYGLAQYRVQQPDTLIVVGDAVTVNGTALVTLRPSSLDATPEFIIRSWFEVLRDGALARLYIEPFKPYSSPELGQALFNMYQQGIARAAEQAPQVVGDAALAEAPEDLERLYENVVAELPGVPHTQVQLAAWNAIEQFYIKSTYRREFLYWQMPGGVNQLDLNPFDGDWLIAWVLDTTGLTRFKLIPPALVVDLTWPIPTTLRNGQALVALKPARFTSQFDPTLWQQWFDTILAGTLHRLYRQPGKSFSNPQLAMFYGKTYQTGVALARGIAEKGSLGRPPSFPYFASGVTK